ncbi:hypothetical protein T4B_9936 [Trichinella pseudospiralis]|uniref:Uncharacterized protein n=1 Tax=Trichinella pseudospiralis TaxID=6337 RepID=A0A0V1GRV5_TRIPS|nr:hypothetical protein T4B_9936 [Trichinella pseudospiralis]
MYSGYASKVLLYGYFSTNWLKATPAGSTGTRFPLDLTAKKLKTLKLTGTRLASIFSGIIPHPLEPFQTAAAARTPCDRTPSLQQALPRCHQHATLLRIVVLGDQQ